MSTAAVPVPGDHGGDGGRIAAALGLDPTDVLDLSASLNPVAPDPRPIVARHLDGLCHYPDAGSATAALAEAIGVERDRLLLTNGGAEAIALVAGHLGVARIDEPEFSLWRRHLRAVDADAPRVRSNPNNPTGLLAARGETAAVWDEAFYPLATGTWTRGDASAGSLVVGSLTKLLACPGLRVGYVITPDAALTQRLAQSLPQWTLNGLAAAALADLLAVVDLPRWAPRIAALRAELVAVLHGHGLQARPSDANWVLVDAPGLRDRLAPLGVVVRDCASFGLDGVVRLAVPDEVGLERLDQALGKVCS